MALKCDVTCLLIADNQLFSILCFLDPKRKSFAHFHLNASHLQAKTLTKCSHFSAYETTPARPHLALFTCLFLLMSFLGVAMYCTDRRRPQRACEELEAALAVYLVHMKQLLWGCWIWLTMQWLWQTIDGDMERFFFYIFGGAWSLQTAQPCCKALQW